MNPTAGETGDNDMRRYCEKNFVKKGEIKMRIKQYIIPCFLSAVTVLCFGFLSPVLGELKQADEVELSQANASVTGTPIVVTESLEAKPSEKLDSLTIEAKLEAKEPVLPLSVNRGMDANSLNMNINGHDTFNFHSSGSNSQMTGGIIMVTPR